MVALNSVPEKDFQRQVLVVAKACNWSVWHIPDARQQVGGKLVGARLAAGLPDLVLVHRAHGFVFAELKREKNGRVRPAQKVALGKMAEAAMVTTMGGAKVRVHLWRPSDYDEVVLPLLQKGVGPVVYGI